MRRNAQFPLEGGVRLRQEVVLIWRVLFLSCDLRIYFGYFEHMLITIVIFWQDNEVQWLWQILEDFSMQEKSEFMMFVNATRR